MNTSLKCVRCGFCCIQQRCSFSLMKYPGEMFADCPALRWTENGYLCMAIVRDEKTKVLGVPVRARKYLETGKGCLAPTNWREDVHQRTKKDVPSVVRYHQPSEAFRALLERQYQEG